MLAVLRALAWDGLVTRPHGLPARALFMMPAARRASVGTWSSYTGEMAGDQRDRAGGLCVMPATASATPASAPLRAQHHEHHPRGRTAPPQCAGHRQLERRHRKRWPRGQGDGTAAATRRTRVWTPRLLTLCRAWAGRSARAVIGRPGGRGPPSSAHRMEVPRAYLRAVV